MFIINTRKKLFSSSLLLHLLPAGTVFVTVLGLTLIGWRNANQAYTAEKETTINNTIEATKGSIIEQLDSYKLVLLGASGLFIASEDVTRTEWADFVSSFNINQNYPGVRGIGYIENATPDTLESIVQKARAEGIGGFRIHPSSSGPDYSVVKYFVPSHQEGLGYNMRSDPARKPALDAAQTTGQATISNKVVYSKTEMPFSGVGFSMYLPVNETNQKQSAGSSQREVGGFVFAPFLANDFFTVARQQNQNENHGLRIYDSNMDSGSLLYESPRYSALNGSDVIRRVSALELYGQKWIFDFRFSPEVVSQATRSRPISSLIVGVMLSFLLSGFVLSLLVARTRVLSHSKQIEVQSAKDELLSLASHQLRTPATSVKQYLGMVLEGFVGKLAPQQANLLEKAYESNERQLHIINELLYVAKIDAKGIVLTPRRINVNKMLQELCLELSATAKKSSQKIRLQTPPKQVYLEADEHCFRMAIENIISNAMKYSYEGQAILVQLSSSADAVRIKVIDRGVGIDPKDVPLLFQRFSRVPNELSLQTSGSGIGLYLSQKLIELHSGRINVESIKGKGSTFTVTLPKRYTPNKKTEPDAGQAKV